MQQAHSKREMMDVAWDRVGHLKDMIQDKSSGHDIFCVETAMIMYNLAFEVYREPPPDGATSDPKPLGDAVDTTATSAGVHPQRSDSFTEAHAAAVSPEPTAEAAACHDSPPSESLRNGSVYAASDNEEETYVGDHESFSLPSPVGTENSMQYPTLDTYCGDYDKDIENILLRQRVQV